MNELHSNVKGSAAMNLHEQYVFGQQNLSNSNIELTYRCPLQCPQCFRDLLTRDNNDPKKIIFKQKIKESFDIPLDDLKKLLNFFNDDISLCGQFSDPIYHSNFYEILDICSKEYSSKTFKIHTAAHQKNLEWYKTAFEKTGKNIIWIFGLDGLIDTSPIYRKNQNSQLVFDAMVLAAQMNINLLWQFIVFGHNEHQIEEAKSIADKYNIKLRLIFTNRESNKIKKASEKYQAKTHIKEAKIIN